jgi:electron transfer flavoprotein alpha subunit
MEGYKNILIVGELDGDGLSSMTAQLLWIGKRLSQELGKELFLIFLGGAFSETVETGYGYGADRVYTAADPLLQSYMTDSYLPAMEQIVTELKPAVVLFGQNDMGRDLAPRLAFRLKRGVTLDCVDLRTDTEKGVMEMVKPVFGGKAYGLYSSAALPQIASVREGAFDPADYEGSRKGEVIPFCLALDPSRMRTKVLRKEMDESLSLTLNLASAKIVVSGGRGLKSKEGVDLIRQTADLVGGAIAGSRPAVDHGWLPSSLQVGLTGRRVNPQVYIAVGISGSLQHMAGCLKAKMIVAVNSDESAPIFKLSHIGVVGDYRQVLEGFNKEVRRIKRGEADG